MDACRIAILERAPGVVDVGAPMAHKELCYDILRDAGAVIARTPDAAFRPGVNAIKIVMGMSGTVDVGAPLPPREKCGQMLTLARNIIEQYNDAQAPVVRTFSAELMGA